MSNSKANNHDEQAPGRIGRRAFLGAALGGAAAASGILTSEKGLFASESLAPAAAAMGEYRELLDTPIVARHQVVIAGGGASGVIAALAAARAGADTLLIERYGFVGGNATAGLMTSYNGFRNERPPEALQTVKGIPAEYVAEVLKLGGLAESTAYDDQAKHDAMAGELPYCLGFDPEAAKVAALQMLKKEGVNFRFHSWITGPMLDGARVAGVVVESKSGRQAIAADVVIDATGDGDIAARAGAPFMILPTEAEGDQDAQMPICLMYRLGGLPADVVDKIRKGEVPLNEVVSTGGIRMNDRLLTWGPRTYGDGLNVDDLTKAEVDLRLELWDRMQELRSKPGMESVYLMQTPVGAGVRETRRIIGEYVVSEKDAVDGTRFPDVIAISSNPVAGYHGARLYFNHEGFDIPYRAIVPKSVEGLILTGRCISCDQVPFKSARSMAPAMAIGQASGCAAALAAMGGIPPRKVDVKALQKLLLGQKAELRM